MTPEFTPTADMERFERIVNTAMMRTSVARVREVLKRLMAGANVDGQLTPEAAVQNILARVALLRTTEDAVTMEKMIQQLSRESVGAFAATCNHLHEADYQFTIAKFREQCTAGLGTTNMNNNCLEGICYHHLHAQKLSTMLQIQGSRNAILRILTDPPQRIRPMHQELMKKSADMLRTTSTIDDFSRTLALQGIIEAKSPFLIILPTHLIKAQAASMNLVHNLPIRMQVRATLLGGAATEGNNSHAIKDACVFTMRFIDVLKREPTAQETALTIFPWISARQHSEHLDHIMNSQHVWQRELYPTH